MDMPKLEPIPIYTKNYPVWARIWRWLTHIRKWKVVEDWRCQLPDGSIAVIPAGFIFDGASIPRPLWAIMSPTGLLFIPSLIHDFAYRYDYVWLEASIPSGHTFIKGNYGASRKHWDNLFEQMCVQVNGLAYVDRIAWVLMRAFGWIAWYQHRDRKYKEMIPGA